MSKTIGGCQAGPTCRQLQHTDGRAWLLRNRMPKATSASRPTTLESGAYSPDAGRMSRLAIHVAS